MARLGRCSPLPAIWIGDFENVHLRRFFRAYAACSASLRQRASVKAGLRYSSKGVHSNPNTPNSYPPFSLFIFYSVKQRCTRWQMKHASHSIKTLLFSYHAQVVPMVTPFFFVLAPGSRVVYSPRVVVV
jgi:hypothetical protein